MVSPMETSSQVSADPSAANKNDRSAITPNEREIRHSHIMNMHPEENARKKCRGVAIRQLGKRGGEDYST